MESFSSTIVIFTIFAALLWIAALAFIILDEKAGDRKWLWIIGTLILGPIMVLPYWFWGRNR